MKRFLLVLVAISTLTVSAGACDVFQSAFTTASYGNVGINAVSAYAATPYVQTYASAVPLAIDVPVVAPLALGVSTYSITSVSPVIGVQSFVPTAVRVNTFNSHYGVNNFGVNNFGGYNNVNAFSFAGHRNNGAVIVQNNNRRNNAVIVQNNNRRNDIIVQNNNRRNDVIVVQGNNHRNNGAVIVQGNNRNNNSIKVRSNNNRVVVRAR